MREVQIRTTVRITSHLSERLLSKSQEITNVGHNVVEGTLVLCWWE